MERGGNDVSLLRSALAPASGWTRKMRSARSHHLAKHSISSDVDVKLHFGSTDPKEIAKEVAKLGQKQLQARHCPARFTRLRQRWQRMV